jgi:tRNA uridine 5-carboxymethylaminomethyl modification enzyme
MFTSRAEFRLHLRIDNADERLTPVGRRAGLVGEERWQQFTRKQEQKVRLLAALQKSRHEAWLRRTESKIEEIMPWICEVLGEEPVRGLLMTIETETKYAGYIGQQRRQIDRLKSADGRVIPTTFQFAELPGLSREIREKLERVRPATLGQAARIPGVTPAAVAVLDVYLTTNRSVPAPQ